jgi:hypothetical protein
LAGDDEVRDLLAIAWTAIGKAPTVFSGDMELQTLWQNDLELMKKMVLSMWENTEDLKKIAAARERPTELAVLGALRAAMKRSWHSARNEQSVCEDGVSGFAGMLA